MAVFVGAASRGVEARDGPGGCAVAPALEARWGRRNWRGELMVWPYSWVLHHGEAIDPTLAEWIRQEIDDLLGLTPATIAVLLGAVIVVAPVVLGVAAVRRRRGVGE